MDVVGEFLEPFGAAGAEHDMVVMDETPSQCSSRRGESLLEPRRLPVRGGAADGRLPGGLLEGVE
ncbi:hypothetical protein SAV14893_078340 [Streptomyces avermitilis]|uniref:Uncharacterized protein n=1 Tax=Streptomyces avermitilis TaxID=33903 RepID=A0A4D4MIV0_STRAX|nr:hypothetical protein SAV14893_078340 [Streptomyces avermitilis]GDY71187.1 hypothetical protein SAV31267_006720 [Streptomyces avermitilis]